MHMRCFYSKNKKSIWLFIVIFSFLFFYDFFLIAHINDFALIKNIHDINKLYELHPYLPLSRIIYHLFPLQYFDKVGFYEVMVALTYIVQGLSIFEIIFLVFLLWNLYDFLFNQNYVNTLTFSMVCLHFIIFVVHIIYSIIKIFNCLVYVNYPIGNAMMDLRFVSIICLSLYIFILIGSLIIMYLIYRHEKLKKEW